MYVRWRSLLVRTLTAQLFRNGSENIVLKNNSGHSTVTGLGATVWSRRPLGSFGLFGVFDQTGEMAENPSAVSDGSGAASSLAAALSGLRLSD